MEEKPYHIPTEEGIELIDRPVPYNAKDDPYEVIKVIQAWGADYCLGCVIKNVARALRTGNRKHLYKAMWHLKRAVEAIPK